MRESVQAEVMMSFLVSEELSFRIPVELRYEVCDPYAVRMTFHLPGDGGVTGQMEGHPDRVRIAYLVPELHRDTE